MEFFYHLEEFHLLICRICRVGIPRSHLDSHLKRQPHRLDQETRTKAMQWAEGLDVISGADDIGRLTAPADTSDAIPFLREPQTGGVRCTFVEDCTFVGASVFRVRRHLKCVHQWEEGTRGGRPRAGARAGQGRYWRCGVLYQRFLAQGPKSEYFEVCRGQEGRAATSDNTAINRHV